MNSIMRATPQAADPPPRKRLAQLLRDKARHVIATVPTSIAQRGVWYMQQTEPASAAYHVSFCIRVVSPLDTLCAREALQLLVDRHAMLRATFHHRGEELEMEIPGAGEADFEQIDAQGLADSELQESVQLAYNKPFDLANGPLVRMHIFSRAPGDHVLLLTFHHLICDGWALGILLHEFIELYEAELSGRNPNLPVKSVDFDHFVSRQREWLASNEGAKSERYWLEQLQGDLPELHMPTYGTDARTTKAGPGVHDFEINRSLLKALSATAQDCGITLFGLLLAAYQAFLVRVSGQDEVLVGVPMAARDQDGCEGVVGHFVNLVAMRARVDGNPSFRTFARGVWADLQKAIEHQQYPFLELVRKIRPTGRSSAVPLFRTHLNILKVSPGSPMASVLAPDKAASNWGPLQISEYPVQVVEEAYDLAVRIVETNESLKVKIQYDLSKFTPEAVDHLSACLLELLSAIAKDPDCGLRQLALLPPKTRESMLNGWNETSRRFGGPALVSGMVEAQAQQSQDAFALVYENEALTYGELDARSNRLARQLLTEGLKQGDVVAVCAGRSIDLVVALLASLKAGIVYVPIDPRYPAERVRFVLDDSGARLIITTSRDGSALFQDQTLPQVLLDQAQDVDPYSSAPLGLELDPESLAYIIYTSGSTGNPKGVQISNRALTNFVNAMRERLPLSNRDSLLSVTTPSFDIFGLEYLLPLVTGARLELASDEETQDGHRLAARLRDARITMMQATPATWRLLMSADFIPASGFMGLCGGEALDPALARQLITANIDLWNMYGPTETTIWSCMEHVVEAAGSNVSIGRPIANTKTYVLDRFLEPVPIGVVGRLFLGGDGLAHGYLHRDELTAEKFIPSPFSDGLLYDTGDLVRYLADGRLECLGRGDHQVKLRGYRIELQEIEAILADHPQVAQAVTTIDKSEAGNEHLVAFVQAKSPTDGVSGRKLRAHLRERLPDYMIPSEVIVVERFPQTPNGKVDRKALTREAYRIEPVTSEEDIVTHLQPAEEFLLEIWRDLLGHSNISIDDNFFELGGHSLLAARMIAKLEGYHHRTLSIALLVQSPTIRMLAKAIEELPALEPGPCMFTFRVGDSSSPLILMPSMAGTALHWRDFVACFDSTRPFVGLYIAGEPDYSHPTSLEELALKCAHLIVQAYPDRPCHLLGYSFGGTLAFEVARQLEALGHKPGVTAILDKGPNPLGESRAGTWPIVKNLINRAIESFTSGTFKHKVRTALWLLRLSRKGMGGRKALMQEYIFGEDETPDRSRRLLNWFAELESHYHPQKYGGDVLVIRASKRPLWGPFEHDLGWSDYVSGAVRVGILKGGHSEMLEARQMLTITELLSAGFDDSRTSHRAVPTTSPVHLYRPSIRPVLGQ